MPQDQDNPVPIHTLLYFVGIFGGLCTYLVYSSYEMTIYQHPRERMKRIHLKNKMRGFKENVPELDHTME